MATITTSPLAQVAALRAKHGIPAKRYLSLTPKQEKAVVRNAVELLAFDFDERSFYVTEGNPENSDEAHRYYNKWREFGVTKPVMVKVPVTKTISRIIVKTN